VSRSSLLHGAHDHGAVVPMPSGHPVSAGFQGKDLMEPARSHGKNRSPGHLVFTATYDAGDMIVYYIYDHICYVYIYIIVI
jgi:hypothetical protein